MLNGQLYPFSITNTSRFRFIAEIDVRETLTEFPGEISTDGKTLAKRFSINL